MHSRICGCERVHLGICNRKLFQRLPGSDSRLGPANAHPDGRPGAIELRHRHEDVVATRPILSLDNSEAIRQIGLRID